MTLVREAPQGFEVLMVQRNFQSVFMPGMNVFRKGQARISLNERGQGRINLE